MIGSWPLTGRKKTLVFIAVLLLQLALLTGMVLNSYTIILWGESINLKVEPIDPRSLFQGDYVRLGYSFNSLDLTKIEHDLDLDTLDTIPHQQKIYLVMAPQNDIWSPVMATLDSSKVKGKTYLEAKVLYAMYAPPTPERTKEEEMAKPETGKPIVLSLKLSIENYFVPEGKGREIEDMIRHGDVYARVALYKGKARIIELVNK